MFLGSLMRWFRRGRIAELERIRSGVLPQIKAPPGYVCAQNEAVHAVARASAESEMGKALGSGILILTSRGVAFLGGKRPIQYTWSQIGTSGVRFAGTGSYSIDTRRGRTIDFQLASQRDAEQLSAVDYALNAPVEDR